MHWNSIQGTRDGFWPNSFLVRNESRWPKNMNLGYKISFLTQKFWAYIGCTDPALSREAKIWLLSKVTICASGIKEHAICSRPCWNICSCTWARTEQNILWALRTSTEVELEKCARFYPWKSAKTTDFASIDNKSIAWSHPNHFSKYFLGVLSVSPCVNV